MTNTALPERCANCLSVLPPEANFCAHCGQKRIHSNDRSIWHLIIESVGDFFHVDSKFFATVKCLLIRPGFLTIEYLAGRRKRYFEPFKLFLFISFIYFLTSGIISHKQERDDYEKTALPAITDTAKHEKPGDGYHLTISKDFDQAITMPDDSLRKLVKNEGLNRFVDKRYPTASWWAKFMLKQVIKERVKGSESFSENFQKTLPKLVFILIPLFALLLKMIYFRKKIWYFNHVIFSLHFLAFFFLMSIIRELSVLLVNWVSPVIFLTIILYLFYSLHRVYAEKAKATFWKFMAFFFGSMFILGVFFILAAMISFLLI